MNGATDAETDVADRRCEHDALLFDSDESLVTATAPFIADGIAAGDVVIVHGPAYEVDMLRQAFDDDPRVSFEAGTDRYRRMMTTVADYQRLCTAQVPAGRRVRSTGPVPLGDDRRTRLEWTRYEALVERALGALPFFGLCRYDTRTTSPEVLQRRLGAHRRIVTADGSVGNDGYLDPIDLLAELAPAVAPNPLETLPPVVGQPDCRAAAPLRHAVADALHRTGVPAESAGEFVAAVHEVFTNAHQHAAPPISASLHSDGRRWLCVITDSGPGLADPWTGFDAPPPIGRGGLGLWAARQLCDQLDIARARNGTKVSLWLDPD